MWSWMAAMHPPGGVGGEPGVVGRVEPLGGFHQADIAFLDEVADGQTVAAELPGDLAGRNRA